MDDQGAEGHEVPQELHADGEPAVGGLQGDIYIYIYIYTHTSDKHMFGCVYIYIYICIYIYIY